MRSPVDFWDLAASIRPGRITLGTVQAQAINVGFPLSVYSKTTRRGCPCNLHDDRVGLSISRFSAPPSLSPPQDAEAFPLRPFVSPGDSNTAPKSRENERAYERI